MSGIYLHIPFCRQACTYCDFHFSTSTNGIEALISSIGRELRLRKDYLQEEVVETIYFGGGTPSFIETKFIKSLLEIISGEFSVHSEPEITLEANPDDLTPEKSDELMEAGVNRLSIGIQSFRDEDLKFMNRAHDSRQALSAIRNVKAAGFRNISVDLIYGIQGSSTEKWEKNIDIALGLEVEHLSCYALTIEPRTALADMIRKHKVPAPDDEKTSSEFELLMRKTSEAGFEHYEISNFARNKKYSRHNTSYWQGKKYLGVGPSAHSYDGDSRQWNVSNNQLYIRSIEEDKLPFEKEELSVSNKFNEYILTTLRTMWGVDVSFVEKEFGKLRRDILMREMKEYIKDGMIKSSGNNFVLTNKGKFFADRIASELFV